MTDTPPAVLIVTGTGITYEGDRAQGLPEAPVKDEHFWTAIAAFRVADPSVIDTGGNLLMDAENLLEINVGCFWCEEPYSKRLAHRRCRGDVSRSAS